MENDSDEDVAFAAFILLLKQTPTRPRVQLSERRPVLIDQYTDTQSLDMFRFNRAELCRLLYCFQLPDMIRVGQPGHYNLFTPQEALLVLLRRLCYPNRLSDLVEVFGMSMSEMSMVFNWALDFISAKYQNRLQQLEMWAESLPHFAERIATKGAPPGLNCVGFLDGTLRPICRPTHGQRAAYSGKARTHGLKYQALTLPNGIIAHLFGPVEGRRHDSTVLGESRLLDDLLTLFATAAEQGGPRYCIYGDGAYPHSAVLQLGYRGNQLSPTEQEFNSIMSSLRVSVEWSFGKTVRYFGFCDFSKNQKVFLQSVSKMYVVSTFLTNCHTCVRGSQVSSFFCCDPPTLEQYAFI
jgi:hypothetical protein